MMMSRRAMTECNVRSLSHDPVLAQQIHANSDVVRHVNVVRYLYPDRHINPDIHRDTNVQ
jgi:hypothetical protein